jgi:hypothetical protein
MASVCFDLKELFLFNRNGHGYFVRSTGRRGQPRGADAAMGSDSEIGVGDAAMFVGIEPFQFLFG